jgi:hypothetical protein
VKSVWLGDTESGLVVDHNALISAGGIRLER